jgi:hypothetical protein
MANVVGTNVITIDTAAAVTLKLHTVQSVVIVASQDSPVVVLTDVDGAEIFRAAPVATGFRTFTYPIGPVDWKGITAATLTNITRVFVNLTSPQIL